MDKKDGNLPHPKELEKELNDYLTNKYGKRFKLGVTASLFPQPDYLEEKGESQEQTKSAVSRINFDLKPEELEAYLDQYK